MSGIMHEMNSEDDLARLAAKWGLPVPPAEPTQANGPLTDVAQVGSIFDFAAQKIEFLIDGILAAGTITMLSGDPGCGKTTLTTAMCSAIERGVTFAGLETQRRPVLILDRENPLPVVVERFKRLGIRDSPNFKVWGGWLPEEPPAAQSPIVSRWVEACDPKPLILVDSLSAFHEGDENSAKEIREFFQGLRRLADLGATVVVLHHKGKSETAANYRGSSDIGAAIDVGYTLANLGDSSRLSTLRLKAFKARFLVQAETILHYVNDQFEVDTRPLSKTNEELLREILISNPGSSRAELEELADGKVKRGRVRELLDQWQVDGLVRVESNDRRRKSHWWNG